MGVDKLLRNVDQALSALNRENLVRGLVGQPAESKAEAALHDLIDLVPIIGDYSSFTRILTNKGNRFDQAVDAFVGLIPIVGDVADALLAGSTNIDQFEEKSIKKMGPVETFVTGKWFNNLLVKYVGGDKNIKSIWHD